MDSYNSFKILGTIQVDHTQEEINAINQRDEEIKAQQEKYNNERNK